MVSRQTIIGESVPNLPWEPRPAGCADVVWRSARNPIIPRRSIPQANSTFNSAVVPFGGAFVGVFRIDDRRRWPMLYVGQSADGVSWKISEEPIHFVGEVEKAQPFEYGYDPRVTKIDDRYYVTWCNGYKGQPTIGVAWTQDFKTFTRLENALLPFNRNGVLLPRKVDGHYVMFSRPSDPGHTPFGEIYCSQSTDMTYWGRHRFVMRTAGGWQATKIGAGPVPIETTEGWLMIYHGVLTSCNGMVYSMGAALLDIEQPWKAIARTWPYLLSPQMDYECVGDTPNVVFPVATVNDAATGRIAIYYGAADTVTCLAYTQVDELIDFVKANSLPC